MAGPLAGIRVLELAGIGPAPLACQLLADLGAEVLRVDRPGAPAVADGLAAGRPALVLDLKEPAGLEQLLDVAAVADVLVEGFRPGTAERLGFGPQICLGRNERLVYARMTGWGQEGPRAGRAGHDINYLSVAGALHAIGPAGGPPVPPINLLADFGGGSMFLVTGVLAALLERERTGAGQVVDAAMVDGVSYLMTMLWRWFSAGRWRDARGANLLDGGAPFYCTYECADGGFVAVGALEPQFYEALVAGLGLPDLPSRDDPANWPELRRRIAAAFATRGRDSWAEHFAGSDACVTAVLGLAEAPLDPHLAARATLRVAAGQVTPAPAPRFSRTEALGAQPGNDAVALLRRWGAKQAG